MSLYFSLIDRREGACYRYVNGTRCGMPLGEPSMKANCCCSSFSQAWGSPCEICPLKNSGTTLSKCLNIYLFII